MNPFNDFNTPPFHPLEDIENFHTKFGLRQEQAAVPVRDDVPGCMHTEEWKLRHARLREEGLEYDVAVERGEEDAILDSLVDLVYIALGTCYRRGWNFAEAWNRIHSANMKKERGEENSSKYGSGFDVIKPEGWKTPNLTDLV